MTPFHAARATAAEAAGSRRSLTRTKFARSNHDRLASVSPLITAPPEPLHGESKINTSPHTHSVKAFEGVQRELFPKSSLWRGQGAEPLALFAPRYLHPDKPQFEVIHPRRPPFSLSVKSSTAAGQMKTGQRNSPSLPCFSVFLSALCRGCAVTGSFRSKSSAYPAAWR